MSVTPTPDSVPRNLNDSLEDEVFFGAPDTEEELRARQLCEEFERSVRLGRSEDANPDDTLIDDQEASWAEAEADNEAEAGDGDEQIFVELQQQHNQEEKHDLDLDGYDTNPTEDITASLLVTPPRNRSNQLSMQSHPMTIVNTMPTMLPLPTLNSIHAGAALRLLSLPQQPTSQPLITVSPVPTATTAAPSAAEPESPEQVDVTPEQEEESPNNDDAPAEDECESANGAGNILLQVRATILKLKQNRGAASSRMPRLGAQTVTQSSIPTTSTNAVASKTSSSIPTLSRIPLANSTTTKSNIPAAKPSALPVKVNNFVAPPAAATTQLLDAPAVVVSAAVAPAVDPTPPVVMPPPPPSVSELLARSIQVTTQNNTNASNNTNNATQTRSQSAVTFSSATPATVSIPSSNTTSSTSNSTSTSRMFATIPQYSAAPAVTAPVSVAASVPVSKLSTLASTKQLASPAPVKKTMSVFNRTANIQAQVAALHKNTIQQQQQLAALTAASNALAQKNAGAAATVTVTAPATATLTVGIPPTTTFQPVLNRTPAIENALASSTQSVLITTSTRPQSAPVHPAPMVTPMKRGVAWRDEAGQLELEDIKFMTPQSPEKSSADSPVKAIALGLGYAGFSSRYDKQSSKPLPDLSKTPTKSCLRKVKTSTIAPIILSNISLISQQSASEAASTNNVPASTAVTTPVLLSSSSTSSSVGRVLTSSASSTGAALLHNHNSVSSGARRVPTIATRSSTAAAANAGVENRVVSGGALRTLPSGTAGSQQPAAAASFQVVEKSSVGSTGGLSTGSAAFLQKKPALSSNSGSFSSATNSIR